MIMVHPLVMSSTLEIIFKEIKLYHGFGEY